jgi:hypothetical protein
MKNRVKALVKNLHKAVQWLCPTSATKLDSKCPKKQAKMLESFPSVNSISQAGMQGLRHISHLVCKNMVKRAVNRVRACTFSKHKSLHVSGGTRFWHLYCA